MTNRVPRLQPWGLPENKTYKVGGCRFHPNCLTCPLPRCYFELTPREAMHLPRNSTLADVREVMLRA